MRRFYLAIFLFAGISLSGFCQKIEQTITFDPIPTGIAFGDAPITLAATSTSGLTVTFTSSNIGIALPSGSDLSILGTSEVTITASQAGNATFNAAPPVTQRIFIQKKDQTITFPAMPVNTYGNLDFTPPASASSHLSVIYTSSDPAVASIVNGKIHINRAGEVQITATQAGDEKYFPAASVDQKLIIDKAVQNVSFQAPPAKTYGAAPFTINVFASSGLPLAWIRSQYDSVADVNGNTITIYGAGSTLFSAYQEGNENYFPASGTYLFTVGKATQTISFATLATQNFGSSPLLLGATASSGLRVSYKSLRRSVATVSGNAVVIHSAGSAILVASQAGNANYVQAPDVQRTLTIDAPAIDYTIIGTTRRGGNTRGTIYTVKTDGTNMSSTYVWQPGSNNLPNGGFLKATDGKLYGVIPAGGTPANGIVFSMNVDGTAFTVLHNFEYNDGSLPSGSLIEASNGYLYGVTTYGGGGVGVIYRISKDGTDFSVLHQFTGSSYNPVAGVVEAADSKLYGTTPQGGIGYGAIYTINLDGTGFNEIVMFDGPVQGSYPRGTLIQGADLHLYGTTSSGGANGKGTVYKIETDGTAYTVLINFDGTSGSNGSGQLTLASTGKLFGMTQRGGSSDKGTLFTIGTDGTGFSALLSFDGTNLGAVPLGSLMESATDGYIYGMTSEGGTSNAGAAFKIKKDGTGFVKLLDFTGDNGSSPIYGPLLELSSGQFAGMTSRGGASDAGTFFSISSTGTYTLLKDFLQPPNLPEELVSNDGVTNYTGVLSAGGANGSGGLFTVMPDGSGYTFLADFPSGDFPFAGRLLIASDHSIWGLRREGVSVFTFSMFRVNPDGTGYQSFAMDDPAIGTRTAALVEGKDGYIYGAAADGGAFGKGTIFRINPDGTGLTHMADIPGGAEGGHPNLLIRHSDGLLYGTTIAGGSDAMVVFRINADLSYSRLTTLIDVPLVLKEMNGGNLAIGSFDKVLSVDSKTGQTESIVSLLSPNGGYVEAINQTVEGYLLVASRIGGANDYGSLIKVLPDGTNFVKILDFANINGAEPNSILMLRGEQQVTSFDDVPQKQFLDPPFTLNATSSSGAPAHFTSDDLLVAEVDGYTVTIKGVGTTTLRAKVLVNGNYKQSTELTKTLTVVQSDQQFTFDAISDKHYGGPDFRLITHSQSGSPITFSSSDLNVATVNKNIVTITGAGVVTITASIAQSPNFFTAVPIQRTFTVLKRNQVIQFDPIGTHYVDTTPFDLSILNPSGLPVTVTSGTPAVATLAGLSIMPVAAGQSQMTGNAAGDANYLDAAPAQQTLSLIKHDQILVFDVINDKLIDFGTMDFFPPRSSSGLDPVLTTTSPGVSISGTTLNFLAAGKVTLKANQDGNALTNAAQEISRTFCVIPSKPTITVDMSDPGHVMLTSSASTGNEWFRNNLKLNGLTSESITAPQSGTYTVRVNIDECIGSASDAESVVVVGLEESGIALMLYPNPVADKLYVRLPLRSTPVLSQLEVHTTTGVRTIEFSTTSEVAELDVHLLPAGLYLLKVIRDERTVVTRFVKQ